jgi:hypothetical protein
MNLWYAAHIVMYVKRQEGASGKTPVWENIVLIKARSEEEAFEKAKRRGAEEEGDDDGTFRWGGKPARWVFAGVRKLTLCEDPDKRPGDGTEISYTEMEVDSEQAVRKLLGGSAVALKLRDRFAEAQGSDNSAAQAR